MGSGYDVTIKLYQHHVIERVTRVLWCCGRLPAHLPVDAINVLDVFCSCYPVIPAFSQTYHIRQNFRGGKLSRLCTKHTIHWKTFAVHQAHAIIYCTQQMIQGENFHDWLKNRENRESFPPRKFCRIR